MILFSDLDPIPCPILLEPLFLRKQMVYKDLIRSAVKREPARFPLIDGQMELDLILYRPGVDLPQSVPKRSPPKKVGSLEHCEVLITLFCLFLVSTCKTIAQLV